MQFCKHQQIVIYVKFWQKQWFDLKAKLLFWIVLKVLSYELVFKCCLYGNDPGALLNLDRLLRFYITRCKEW
jgi:hypothetical protein